MFSFSFFGFPFRVMFVIRHLFPEIREEVPENVSRRLNFFDRGPAAHMDLVPTKQAK
jgi:hypothetical protein